MTLLEIFLIGIGLSMDAFAVSVCKGLAMKKAPAKALMVCGAWFGGFQALMPLIGYYLGTLFIDAISAIDHWIAFALLGFIGGKMIWDAVKELRAPEACPVGRAFSYKLMVVQAFATSIDALAVGVSFAALDVNIAAAASFIACVTFVCCLAGHLLGKKFGSWLGGKAEIFGGVILVCIGAKILVEHLSGG